MTVDVASLQTRLVMMITIAIDMIYGMIDMMVCTVTGGFFRSSSHTRIRYSFSHIVHHVRRFLRAYDFAYVSNDNIHRFVSQDTASR